MQIFIALAFQKIDENYAPNDELCQKIIMLAQYAKAYPGYREIPVTCIVTVRVLHVTAFFQFLSPRLVAPCNTTTCFSQSYLLQAVVP